MAKRSATPERTAAISKSHRAQRARRHATAATTPRVHHAYVPVDQLQPRLEEDLAGFEEVFKQRTGNDIKPFQLQAIAGQWVGKDVVVQAGTGAGKTAIAAGPHFLPSAKGRVSILVSPILALQANQEKSLTDWGLSAKAINSTNGGCQMDVLKRVVAGEWSLVIISPELLLSRNFIKHVLRNHEFGQRVVSVIVDEAHVVSRWGHSFRKKYSELGIIRAFLPRGTPIIALSATLARRVRRDVLRTLAIQKEHVLLDLGNDRPNVALAVRAMQHTATSFADLDFVIPEKARQPSSKPTDVPPTWIFFDSINGAIGMIDHIEDLLPEHLRRKGLVRPFSAAMAQEYRTEVLELFKEGVVRVLVCTDAAGMGCDIPNVEVVVQWKMPDSLSAFVQRAGRAARRPGSSGLAVLIVEPSAFETDVFTIAADPPSQPSGKQKKSAGARPKKERTAYAQLHGLRRGWRSGKWDHIQALNQPSINHDAEDEGLHAFVQTGLCRRRVTKVIYDDPSTQELPSCCDVCHPELLNKIRPGPKPPSSRAAQVKIGVCSKEMSSRIRAWRDDIYEDQYAHTMISADAFMADELIERLASVGPIKTRRRMNEILKGEWVFLDLHGTDLWLLLSALEFASFEPLPKKSSSAPGHKRGPSQMDAPGPSAGEPSSLEQQESESGLTVAKRQRQGTVSVGSKDASGTPAATRASSGLASTSSSSLPSSRAPPVPPAKWTYTQRPPHLASPHPGTRSALPAAYALPPTLDHAAHAHALAQGHAASALEPAQPALLSAPSTSLGNNSETGRFYVPDAYTRHDRSTHGITPTHGTSPYGLAPTWDSSAYYVPAPAPGPDDYMLSSMSTRGGALYPSAPAPGPADVGYVLPPSAHGFAPAQHSSAHAPAPIRVYDDSPRAGAPAFAATPTHAARPHPSTSSHSASALAPIRRPSVRTSVRTRSPAAP